MQRWRSKAFILAGAALGLSIPAFSQDRPESLLPPGFGNQAQQNEQVAEPPRKPLPVGRRPIPPVPAPPTTPAPATPVPPVATGQDIGVQVTDSVDEDLELLIETGPPPIELPDYARRPTDIVGALGPDNWGLGLDAFQGANGRFLSTLMRRTAAPLPSRWTSMLLRRALLSRVPAPRYVHPVDWVAERAWLLLRMGEADAARMLVQAVDVDRFTPKMYSVAVQTALATADPAALCPLIEGGQELSDEPIWPLSEAVCASLAGEANRAAQLIDRARSRGTAKGIDLLLAEKIVGAGEGTRRAVTIEWDDVDSLNAWRFGMAAAAGVDIPGPLMQSAGPRMQAWRARAPMIPLDQRVEAAQVAASLGVFSNASLVEMHSLLADNTDPNEILESVGGRLRMAYVGRGTERRLAALHDLWDDAQNPVDRHARRILTAVAAARFAPSEALAADAPELIASMLSAGMDRYAARWAPVVDGLDGQPWARAWPLLAVASPDPQFEIDAGQIEAVLEQDDSPRNHRTKLLFAALAGLGRLDAGDQERLAERFEIPLGRENRWTRMLDAAAEADQPGTVALLAAVGMQTPTWDGVPPSHLYRIVRALRQVGLEYEARMIAAEALTRL